MEEVEIVNNQFSRDIIEVLETNNSPTLYISCNRLIGEAVNLECAKISYAMHTLLSVPSLTESSPTSVFSAALDIKSGIKETNSEQTILWLLLVVGLVVSRGKVGVLGQWNPHIYVGVPTPPPGPTPRGQFLPKKGGGG